MPLSSALDEALLHGSSVGGATPLRRRGITGDGDQIETIEEEWNDVCELARLSEIDQRRLWSGSILNPYALEGY